MHSVDKGHSHLNATWPAALLGKQAVARLVAHLIPLVAQRLDHGQHFFVGDEAAAMDQLVLSMAWASSLASGDRSRGCW